MKLHRILLLTLFTLSGTLTLSAHHSVHGTYDSSNPVTLSGVITKSERRNPHTRIELEVPDVNGTGTVWIIELAAPRKLFEKNFDLALIDAGQHVTVEAWRARDLQGPNKNWVAGRVLITRDGTRWDIHDAWADFLIAPGAPR